MSSLAPPVLLISGSLLWGLSWIPLQHLAAQGLSGMPLVVLIYGVLSVLALPVLWHQRRAWLAQYGRLAIIALGGGWGTTALVCALADGDVVRVMLLFYLSPIWATLGACWWFGERLTRARVLALLLAFGGIGLTLGISDSTLQPLTMNDWLALSAGLGFSLNNLATRAGDQIPLASKSVVSFVASTVLAGGLCLLLGQYLPVVTSDLAWQIGLLALAWLVVQSMVQFAVTHMEAGLAAVLVIFELIGAVLSSAWLGEHAVLCREWAGAVLVSLAALIAAWPASPTLSPDARSTSS
jgi:drug/metabolite transporter (DMT)-like permease